MFLRFFQGFYSVSTLGGSPGTLWGRFDGRLFVTVGGGFSVFSSACPSNFKRWQNESLVCLFAWGNKFGLAKTKPIGSNRKHNPKKQKLTPQRGGGNDLCRWSPPSPCFFLSFDLQRPSHRALVTLRCFQKIGSKRCPEKYVF